MRKPSQQLRKLIRSLSPQELKYVRQEIASNKDLDSEQYLRMMDLIYQAEAPYDESAVRRKMQSGYFVTHFSQAKANLYALISGSLIRFYRQKDIALEFIDRLAWVELLSQRDMSSQLDEQLSSMKEIAGRTGLLWMDFLVQQWQFKAAIQSGNPERLQLEIDQLQKEGAVRLQNLNVWHRVQEISLFLLQLSKNQGDLVSSEMTEQIRTIFAELEEIDRLNEKSFEIKLYTSISKFLCLEFLKDPKSIQQAALVVDIEHSMAELGKASSLDLVKRLGYLVASNYKFKRYEEAKYAYDEILKLINKEQGPWLLRSQMRLQINVWLKLVMEGQIERAISSIEESEGYSVDPEDDAGFLAFWYLVRCWAYMAGGRYSQLKELTLKVEQEVNAELSTDHFVILRLCQLICAFKERDVVAFNSLYRSSVRSFEKRGVYDDSLKMFCTGLNACRKDNDRNRRQMFEEFVNFYSNHTEQHTLLFYSKIIFVIWAAAESKGISVEEWYKNYNNQ